MPSDMAANGAEGVEETSPDMLKNTPSNIRRLVNEIEQYESRQKYLAHTRSPSDGGDVRWYFCKVPLAVNELAASVPRTEIVGKGDYFRFGMRDSLAIEASFLQREDELLSSWWKEYAECSEGPRGKLPSSKTSLKSSETPESLQLFTAEEERVGVPVKGGLYENYMPLHASQFVRWTWSRDIVFLFTGMERIDGWYVDTGLLVKVVLIGFLFVRMSEQLEYAYRSQVWHRRTFQPSGLFAARVDLQGSTPGLHALFTGEDDTWEAWLSVDSGFSSVVGFGRNNSKLRRGYAPSQSQKPTKDELRQQKEEEMDDYCSQVPVRHLVFMVHGIGQRLEKSNLVDDVGDFRHVTASLAERHLTSHQRGTQRVLYIPCQWRKGLTLSGETAVEKITLDGVRGLRTMLSATVHDVLYYMSPIYCQDIIDSVSNQLNRLYLKFLKRNPGYDGKVSIYGHSLGSVLSYDILCHQETLYSPFPMEWMYKEHKRSEVPCTTTNTSSASGNPISNSGDESTRNVGEESIVGHEHNTDLVEEPVEGTCNQLGPAASSESDESTTIDTGYQPTNAASPSDENPDEPSCSSDHMEFYRSDMKADSNSMKSGVVPSDNNKDGKDISNNGKDEIIKSLREEIDLLKAKIKEFEAEYADRVNAKESTALVNRPDPESVQPRDSLKSYTPQIRYTKLEFKVDTFFAVGSPLGVFLSLRNVRIGIGVEKVYVGFQEFKEGLASRSHAFVDQMNTVRESKNTQVREERSYGSLMMERLTGSIDGRIDHVLQDKTFRHPYLSAIGSHTNYWRDYDTALFILKHLYRDIPDGPISHDEQPESSSKDENSYKQWSDPREIEDEELPLTFADSVSIKNFSHRAKKTMK
ncbi:UNVERIFIED_CONTAM: Phospholipase SGR2 [Sesamum calycinum]|uniref:Phospholipase SGR2 n=1 Tax=Sesamum calycinum TaxID=2727403 RepID=A0AAW2SF76_9LAMI